MGVWVKLGEQWAPHSRYEIHRWPAATQQKMYVFFQSWDHRAWRSPQNLGSKKLMASTLCRKVIATLEFHAGQSDISVRFSVVVHWTIYSATTILGKCRKVVPEKWFCKLGFFSGQALFSNQISWTRFLEPDFSNQISRTRYLEPDFSNQISKNCKNRGRRIKGWLSLGEIGHVLSQSPLFFMIM